ncbi:hypothetical protein PR202_gb21225 [Eleusine coracana subsp. coracana]|uniref:Uncharacterized protein n=1 Tax=Eleusine coracana subsp. coracana TaxID=191504 RepID=A0AAV5FCU7_ELECO|nr:hypothetical protein QOZ80_7BG0603720 [Eleusine coracana subsp. coracana]GJN32703.1 hypothetical protein PR202_gb21225 [Eleusine coracana subsp. coracana]
MACTAKVTIILFLCAAAQAYCHAATDHPGTCNVSDIHVTEVPTGKVVGGQPEYRVTFDNQCSCPIAFIEVQCVPYLPSTEPVDQRKIRYVASGMCVLNDKLPLSRGSPVTFNYAWKTPPSFNVTSGVPQC